MTPETRRWEQYVYFLRDDREPPRIKIGCSCQPLRRQRQIERRCRTPLVLLGTLAGGRDLERSLLQRFAHLALGGEWFTAEAELVYFIETQVAPPWEQDH